MVEESGNPVDLKPTYTTSDKNGENEWTEHVLEAKDQTNDTVNVSIENKKDVDREIPLDFEPPREYEEINVVSDVESGQPASTNISEKAKTKGTKKKNKIGKIRGKVKSVTLMEPHSTSVTLTNINENINGNKSESTTDTELQSLSIAGKERTKKRKGKGRGNEKKRKPLELTSMSQEERLQEQYFQEKQIPVPSLSPKISKTQKSTSFMFTDGKQRSKPDFYSVAAYIKASDVFTKGVIEEKRRKRRSRTRGAESMTAEDSRKVGFSGVEGIATLTLSSDTQNSIGCVIGKHVTTEKPWIEVRKDMIDFNLDTYEEDSDFFGIKDEIITLKLENVTVGYDSASGTPNQFFVCVTEGANNYIRQFLASMQADFLRRAEESVHRSCRGWLTLGSEKEIEELQAIETRPLYQVEVETTLNKLLVDTDFVDRHVDYTCLLPGKDTINLIEKKRLETGIQAVPVTRSSFVQTPLPLPVNSWTQYEYMVSVSKEVDFEILQKMKEFFGTTMPSFEESIKYSGLFDLYKEDYPDLILRESDTKTPEKVVFADYQYFLDIKRCKGKYISAIAWHPLWSGIVACAYVDNKRTLHIREDGRKVDEVSRAVHEKNPVLVWSFGETLAPKLILECPREVHALKFCPFNENILIGGCINGQVVIWDLSDKLRKVEEEIILTLAQEKCRKALFDLMAWMKNIKKIDHVQPAAMSSLEFSPTECITGIEWLSPYYEISKTGKYEDIKYNKDTALQFLTSSEDGTVCVWDMQARFNIQVGLVKPRKKKRDRPPSLEADISQFRHLHMIFAPIFRIHVKDDDGNKNTSISSLSYDKIKINMELKTLEPNRTINLIERYLHRPLLQKPEEHPRKEFYVGTMDGKVVRAGWEGYDFNTGEAVNSETCKPFSWGVLHGAPICSISRSTFLNDLILTVSSKVFAIWREDYKDEPLFWRRSRVTLTYGIWSEFQPNLILLTRVDGSGEVWDLLARSDGPVLVQSLSGRSLTGIYPSILGSVQNVNSVADHNGSLRIFRVLRKKPQETHLLSKFFHREKERKILFDIWKNRWMDKHAEMLETKRKIIEEEMKMKEEENAKKEKIEEEMRLLKEEQMRRQELKRARTYGFKERAEDLWKAEQDRRITKSLMDQRKIDRKELIAKQESIKKAKEQEERNKIKREERIREQHKISEGTVKLLFPKAIDNTEEERKRMAAIKANIEGMESVFISQYREIENNSLSYIKENPFKCEFGWNEVFSEGKSRQEIINRFVFQRSVRDDRYLRAKTERKLLRLNLLEKEDQISSKVEVTDSEKSVQFGVSFESEMDLGDDK